MSASIVSFVHLLLTLTVLAACQRQPENKATPCTYPHQVIVSSECYTGNGLEVRAMDYGDSPSGFEWNVIVLKDTSGSWGWTTNDLKMNILGSDKLRIPDSLLTNYGRLIVKVATNCQGTLKHSIYYGYVKSRSATGNCAVWTQRTN